MRPVIKKNKFLIIFVGVLFVLSLNFFQKEVKGFFYSLSEPLQKTYWQAGDKLSDFLESILRAGNLKKENEQLKLEIQEALAESSFLKELKKENQSLKEALGLGLQKELRLTMAEITGKDPEKDVILINKGAKDGLSESLPVITSKKVLLGKTSDVYDNFARVMLISNQKSSFEAKIADNGTIAIVKGQGGFKIYFDLLPKEAEIKEGDLVVSATLSGIYPKGLLVGLIKEVRSSDPEPFQQAEISPFFDIRELEKVFIITDF